VLFRVEEKREGEPKDKFHPRHMGKRVHTSERSYAGSGVKSDYCPLFAIAFLHIKEGFI
jgi:hypothetical protein